MSKHTSRVNADNSLLRGEAHKFYELVRDRAILKLRKNVGDPNAMLEFYEVATENEPRAGELIAREKYGEAYLQEKRVKLYISLEWLKFLEERELKAGQVGANGAKYVKR